MKFTTLLLAATLFLNLSTCTEKQLSESRIAETFYLELLYSVHHNDLAAAIEAASNLNLQLDNLRPIWQRPMSRTGITKCRAHLNEAENAFADIKPALLKGKKDRAIIQLDRAMSELSAADHTAFTKIYSGQLYDFYTTWRETSTIINDQMLCLLEWTEYTWWANLVSAEWAKLECTVPDPAIYEWSAAQRVNFMQAQARLGIELAAFARTISRGDQCISQESAKGVEQALWKFMLCLKEESPANSMPN